MNKVMLVGRICNDLELRYTNNDKAVVEFSLATNRPVMRDGERVTDFITCVVFGGQAENLTKYQGKGSMIGIEGSYRVDTYQDKDGNNRYKHYVLVSSVEFLGSKKATDTPEETPAAEKRSDAEILKEVLENDPYAEFGQQMVIEDEDLPF